MLRLLTFKRKIEKNSVSSLKYTPVTQSVLCLIFLMYVRSIQHLNYGGQESKKKKFAVYDYDIPVTMKQGQDRQTWFELVDPKRG